jgi:hypothetical protein
MPWRAPSDFEDAATAMGMVREERMLIIALCRVAAPASNCFGTWVHSGFE